MWGTLFPLITEGFTGRTINVGPPFYNTVNIPIGLVLLALMGIGPVIAWRRASSRNLKKNFALPLAIGLGTLVGFMIGGMRHTLALATFSLSAFVMTIIVVEFWKGTRARARIEGEGFVKAFRNLVGRNRRRWGGYIVHAGVVIVFTGLAGAAFNVEQRMSMDPGDEMTITSPYGHEYRLVYEGLSHSRPAFQEDASVNEWRWTALVSAYRGDERVALMRPERRYYLVNEQSASEVGIRSTALEDLYVILAEADLNDTTSEHAIIEVLVKPLVGWIWYGGLIITIGALIGMWPGSGVPTRQVNRGGASRKTEDQGQPA